MTTTLAIDVLDLTDVTTAMSRLTWWELKEDGVIPTATGIYVWVDEADRLLYVGKADNAGGLKSRLATHHSWKRKLAGESIRQRRSTVMGVLSGLTERNARVVFAASKTPAEDEATLIAYSALITGHRPLLNGAGWDWSAGTSAASNRAIAIAERLGR